jgi:hypothetical protein
MSSAPKDPIDGPMKIGTQNVPGIWQYLLPADASWLQLPRERTANCEPCYRSAIGDCRDDCRCCTYFPQLPNYMMGLALQTPGARPTVQRLIEEGYALPQGLLASPQSFRLAVEANASDEFGLDRGLVCPFFTDSDGCSIHPFRNAVCATYFCEHDHGQTGETYWSKLRALVGHIETVLTQWAMTEAGIGAVAYIARMDSLSKNMGVLSAEQAWSPEAHQVLWGDWLGREIEFFEACADRVKERRGELYQLACGQSPLLARGFDKALLEWIPQEYRDAVPPLPEGEPVPIQEQWYSLQLRTRQLWELPFDGEPVALCPGVAFETNAGDDAVARFHQNKPRMLRQHSGDDRLFMTEAEYELLVLFKTPQVFDEDFFEGRQILALDEPREFLAHCLRRGFLVTHARMQS